ncbi:MAG: tRNA 2-thiouridine(34) synthase MnmA [Rikenellaceae bacterium]|nr:tRNA 2-thiouridine(34) synthase MnmA [Rikenellaceae bacterium]
MKKVVVGLSGGVDSSVAAYILKKQGYDVIGLFMQNWHDKTGVLAGDCPWYDDRMFAELVAKKLDIPFHYVDLSGPYMERVVNYMFSEYEKGRTPNPDILCNREIKFDAFLNEALKLGADYVATGHYCRKKVINTDGKEIYRLLAGKDPNKDQSYFLCQLSQEQLSKAIFPIGELLKPEVRRIAMEQGLATAERKDSQGICFVGKVDLPVFLQQKLKAKNGDIVEIPADWSGYQGTFSNLKDLSQPYTYKLQDGNVIGKHDGAHFFTIGQRKGLGIGGKAEPLFVIGTDIEDNVVYVGQGQEHPGLYRQALFISNEEIHWIREDLKMDIGMERELDIRIRYRQPLQKGKLIITKEGAYIIFQQKQRGITAGQFAAWYSDDELLGSGVINK